MFTAPLSLVADKVKVEDCQVSEKYKRKKSLKRPIYTWQVLQEGSMNRTNMHVV